MANITHEKKIGYIHMKKLRTNIIFFK